MIDPLPFAMQFFDDSGNLKADETGKPALQKAAQLRAFLNHVPRDQLPNVTKLYSLEPAHAGILFAGSSGFGNWSIRNLVDAFKQSPEFVDLVAKPYEIEALAGILFTFLNAKFTEATQSVSDDFKPAMEVVLSGYSTLSFSPEIFRLKITSRPDCRRELEKGRFNIIFSGQYDVIQRVVLGVDAESFANLSDAAERMVNTYRAAAQTSLTDAGLRSQLPIPDFQKPEMQLFGSGLSKVVNGLDGDRSDLSEQAAINLVDFLIETMIKAQQFSGSIPTVGGDVHLAIITKSTGFRWISREEYLFHGHTVPKHG